MKNVPILLKACILVVTIWLALMWPVYVLRHGKPAMIFKILITIVREWGVFVGVVIVIAQAYLLIRGIAWLLKIGDHKGDSAKK